MLKFNCFLLLVLLATIVNGLTDYSYFVSPDDIEDGETYTYNFETEELTRQLNSTSCKKPGTICDGCRDVYLCIQIEAGFIIEQIDSCPTNQTCLSSTGACTAGPNPDCSLPGYSFICNQVGLLPDAFNCQQYHLCIPDSASNVKPEPLTQKCTDGFYYNVKTTLCNKKLVNGTCPEVAPHCSRSGETGPIIGNSALYYVCYKDSGSPTPFPHLFYCPNNLEYDDETKGCVDPTPKSLIGTDGKCTSTGLFYDPTSCFFYYECGSINANPARKACPSKMHFNHKTKKCIDFTCAEIEK